MLAARLVSRRVQAPLKFNVAAVRSLATGKGRAQPPRASNAQKGRPPVRGPSAKPAAAKPQSRMAAMAGAGAGSAAARAKGRFLREEEEEEDALLDEDEDFDDDFDPHALPSGAALSRMPYEDELGRDADEEQAAVRDNELAYAEELEKEPADELDEEQDFENTFDLTALKSAALPFKATPELYRDIKKIVQPTGEEEDALDEEEAEEEENSKLENPEFVDASAIPAIQKRDREAVAEAIFNGYFKEQVKDAKERQAMEADQSAFRRLRSEFFAKLEAGKYTEEQMKAWAASEFKDWNTNVTIPMMDALIEAQAPLKEMAIETFYKSAEEAQKAGIPCLPLGNKWVPPANFVRIKQKEFEAFFPEGAAGTLEKEWLLMNNRRNILVRQPALQVCNALEKQLASRFTEGPPAHFITGGPGYGKSCVLSTIVYWARKNGWLVVWIPSGFNFVNNGNLQRSRREPLKFDQPEVAMPFLDTFGKGNAHIIGNIKLRTSFTIGVPNVVFTSEGKTLLDLVNFGKEDFYHSTDAAFYLRQELNLIDEYPILVAIDDYNLLHSHAVNLYDPDFQKLNPPLIRPEKLVLPSLFMSWQNHGIVNGTMVCAMTNTKPRNTKEFDAQFPRLPTTYTVPRYNREEFLTIVANYEQNGYIHSPATTETYKYVYHMCAGRGREIYKMLALY